ncbi:AraC family transcriptional regulator [Bacteroides ovatus]|uniref:AraC family transcriptional regulator n=1 Tax=Bacteroides ovatus TaxID=28116 RepID=UPI00321A71DB
MNTILREITSLSDKDCFMVYSRVKNFTFPLHVHPEYELNYIENGTGVKRVVGDSVENIDDLELTLITKPNLEHGWFKDQCESTEVKEITIQFHCDLFNEKFLNKNQFYSVKEMFEKAVYGITFPRQSILKIRDKLHLLASEPKSGYSVLKLFEIIYDLSLEKNIRKLSSKSFSYDENDYDSKRIKEIYNYMLNNYQNDIHLSDASNLIGMSENALSRFLKQKTGRNFIDSLNEIRLGQAARMLIDTTLTVSEICYKCGFNNISNFNRIFKKKKRLTPNEFRETYKKLKHFF